MDRQTNRTTTVPSHMRRGLNTVCIRFYILHKSIMHTHDRILFCLAPCLFYTWHFSRPYQDKSDPSGNKYYWTLLLVTKVVEGMQVQVQQLELTSVRNVTWRRHLDLWCNSSLSAVYIVLKFVAIAQGATLRTYMYSRSIIIRELSISWPVGCVRDHTSTSYVCF